MSTGAGRCRPPSWARAGTEAAFWVHVTDGDAAHVWVRLEDGTVRSGVRQLDNFTPPYDLDGRMIGEATFALPADLPLGYHRVHLRSGTGESSAALIVTPPWLGLPDRLGHRRLWGLATQLYSVRSKRSWGVGDLTDLTDLAVWSAARHGAGYLLINPLHAAAPTKPMEPSPYLPTSRRFVNPLYLRVEAIPEYADLPKRKEVHELHAELTRRAAKLDGIDRDAAWKAKRRALKLVHRVKRSAGRELAYGAFRAREGAALEAFATWCALAERHGADWHDWPESLRHPEATGSQSSSKSTAPQSISTAGCSGSSMSNSQACSPRRPAPAWRWGSWRTSRSGCIPTVPTPGRCRMCWHSASPRAHRPMSTTSWARTGRSHRGGPTNSRSASISRSGS